MPREISKKRIHRPSLLQVAECVYPGVSKQEKIPQSDCFVFAQGMVLTYNDEVACRLVSGLDENFRGAVPAEDLLFFLRKIPDDELILKQTDQYWVLKGHAKKAEIKFCSEVLLEIGTVEEPKDWHPLHEHFSEALSVVRQIAGPDDPERFKIACVHLHPFWVEACSSYQACRWRINTGLRTSCLAHQRSLKQLIALGMTEVAEGSAWLHFRNPQGLVISVRRWEEEFYDLEPYFQVKGKNIPLPKTLGEAARLGEYYAKQLDKECFLEMFLSSGTARVRAVGVSGSYEQTHTLSYQGPDLHFRIAPEVLKNIVKQHSECVVSGDKLAVLHGHFCYVLHLLASEPPNGEYQENAEERA